MITIRPAVHADAWAILPYIQEADRREFEATGLPIAAVLAYSIAISRHPLLAHDEAEPVAMWGLPTIDALDAIGSPWLITCRAIQRHRIRMVREGLAQLAAWRAEGLALIGMVDDRYGPAADWMERAGFVVGPPTVRIGPDRRPFRRFARAA